MFLKRERPETDDFAIKKYLVVDKILSIFQEMKEVLGDTLTQIYTKMSLHILFLFIFLFSLQKLDYPPPLNGNVR